MAKVTNILSDIFSSNVRLSLKEADEYLLYHSDADRERIIWAILNDKKRLSFSKTEVERWVSEKEKYDEQNARLFKTAGLNNNGISLEKEGRIEDAIKVYEENIEIGYPATHSYKRLMVLYRKQKDYINEERVILRAMEIFDRDMGYYETRLTKCRKLKENVQLES